MQNSELKKLHIELSNCMKKRNQYLLIQKKIINKEKNETLSRINELAQLEEKIEMLKSIKEKVLKSDEKIISFKNKMSKDLLIARYSTIVIAVALSAFIFLLGTLALAWYVCLTASILMIGASYIYMKNIKNMKSKANRTYGNLLANKYRLPSLESISKQIDSFTQEKEDVRLKYEDEVMKKEDLVKQLSVKVSDITVKIAKIKQEIRLADNNQTKKQSVKNISQQIYSKILEKNYIEAFSLIKSHKKDWPEIQYLNEMILFLSKKLNVFLVDYNYEKTNSYVSEQIINYSADTALNLSLKNNEVELSLIGTNIDLKKLFENIKSWCKKEYFVTNNFLNEYHIPMKDLGITNNNYIKVITLPDTNEIITMQIVVIPEKNKIKEKRYV